MELFRFLFEDSKLRPLQNITIKLRLNEVEVRTLLSESVSGFTMWQHNRHSGLSNTSDQAPARAQGMTLFGIKMGPKLRIIRINYFLSYNFPLIACATKKLNEYKSLRPFLHVSHLHCWAVELTLGHPFNMVRKFIFFGLLLSAPLAITGLKCFQSENIKEGGGPATLVLCPANSNKMCTITDSKYLPIEIHILITHLSLPFKRLPVVSF